MNNLLIEISIVSMVFLIPALKLISYMSTNLVKTFLSKTLHITSLYFLFMFQFSNTVSILSI
jgi:hypothetical protein